MLKERDKSINYNRDILEKDLYAMHNISSFLRDSELFYNDFVFTKKHLLTPIILNELENTLLKPNNRYYQILKSLYDKFSIELDLDLLKKKYLNKGTQFLFSAFAINHFREKIAYWVGYTTTKKEELLCEIEDKYIRKCLNR